MTTTCDAGNPCIGLRQVQNVAGVNHNEKTLIHIYQSSTSCRWSVFGISKTRMHGNFEISDGIFHCSFIFCISEFI